MNVLAKNAKLAKKTIFCLGVLGGLAREIKSYAPTTMTVKDPADNL